MICTNCGKQALEGAKFCDACGAPLPVEEPAAVQEVPAQESQLPEEAPVQPSQQTQDAANAVPPQPEQATWSSTTYQPGVAAPVPEKPVEKKSKTDPMSTGQFFLMDLISIIPVVNLIVFIVWSFVDSVNVNRRNWARARLLWIGIGLALLAIIAIIIIVTVSLNFGRYGGMMYQHYYW